MPVILPGETDLYALTDEGLSRGRSLEEVARSLLGAGIRILQYREKKKKDGEKLEQCRLLRRITSEYNACFIVDDHVDIAMLCGADGVHVGQEDIPLADVRALVGTKMCIGVSTHAPEQARAAVQGGADYIGPVGLEYLDWVCTNLSIPFVCIGGIKAHNIHDVASHGAKCCALVSEFVAADDIAEAVARTRAAMHS